MAEPMTPEWFRDRLYTALRAQQDEFAFFNAYYTGNHPLPWVAPQAKDEFRRMIRMTRSNYMGLVCDAQVERSNVEGFRFVGDDAADSDSWRIWQANNLDADFDMGLLESSIAGKAYLLAAPNPDDRSTPHIWVEHPSQCIIGYEPGTNRRQRRAGLKLWDDEWTGEIHATVYLMVNGRLWLWKYAAAKPTDGSSIREWRARRPRGEDWPANGQMDVLPLVELPNNPRLLTGGTSELYDVTDAQDRVNKTLFDRLQTQEYGVDPQKWAKAFPDEDEDGNPNVVEWGRNRMVTTNIAETEFGNFAVAPLDPYSAAKREDVKDIASRTRTPAQYLLGEMSNVNGETLKASESGLISKVRERHRTWGEGAEEIIRIARRLAGLATPSDARMETIWSDPQYRTDAERTDAAIKRYQGNVVPLRQTREDLGYSQAQIERMEEADDAEATRAAAVSVKAIRNAANGSD